MSASAKSTKFLQSLAAIGLGAALAAALVGYYDVYVNWQPALYPWALAFAGLGAAALTLLALWAGGERKPLALLWKTALSVVVFSGVVLAGLSAVINNGIYGAQAPGPKVAAAVALPLCAAQIVVLYIRFLRHLGKRAGRSGVALTAAGLCAAMLLPVGIAMVPWYLQNTWRAPAPSAGEEKPDAAHPDRHPTMTDYWEGNAHFLEFYSEPGFAHRATEIVPVNGVWYRFERYVNDPFEGAIGMNVCKSADGGMTWTVPVRITTPGGDDDWSRCGTDCGAYYDGSRWHLLFQSLSLAEDARWNISYLACDEEDATSGAWYTPPGVVNPVIHNGDIWNQIAVGINTCTMITGGQKRVYDEGTPKILVDDGTIYVTFHGASNTRGAVFGYKGIAATDDFVNYTKAANDCIFSRLDALGWTVDWNRGGPVGGGAAAYLKDGEYWYTLIESPDISLICLEGQNWPFGLLRSKALASTKWENWPGNPLPEFTPVGPALAAWVYSALFADGGVTYLAVSQCYIDPAYRQYELVWKE